MIGALSRRGLPREVHLDWRRAVLEAGERDDPVLAWAPTVDDTDPASHAIGTRGRLWVRGSGGWQQVGWHTVEHGSWNGETRRLAWVCYDRSRGGATLTEPGRLPDLFRERIAASVAVEETVQVGSGRTLTVSGRRDLARPGDPIDWHTSLGRGLDWTQPGLAEQAESTLARLRAEYDRV